MPLTCLSSLCSWPCCALKLALVFLSAALCAGQALGLAAAMTGVQFIGSLLNARYWYWSLEVMIKCRVWACLALASTANSGMLTLLSSPSS